MFNFRQLEVVHWDYWERFTLPLDSDIVTVVGPNGSGKTTLLDALRTLLAINCSSGRDYKRYVRRSDRPYAWLRAVVGNPKRGNGQLAFWPITTPQVTLVCRIARKGGDWERHYGIAAGVVTIEQIDEPGVVTWVGVRQYESQLEGAGLTRAIKRVLALDQGHTDKLCEYSPRQLLELVFDVFGDKEVLDNYDKARSDQREVERELEALKTRLSGLGMQLREAEAEVNSFNEYKRLVNDLADLNGQWLPRLRLVEQAETIRGARSQLRGKRRERIETLAASTAADAALTMAATASEKATENEAAGKIALDARHEDERRLLKKLSGPQGVVDSRARLLRRAEQQLAGFDAAAAALEQDRLSRRRYELEQRAAGFADEKAELEARISALESGRPPESREVIEFRAALQREGIAHSMLADIVEITDDHWQGALEAVLQGSRHIVLLEHAQDRDRAWRLGEQLHYRHFVTPDRGAAPPASADSLLTCIRFKADPPIWLARLLNDIRRVPDVSAGSRLPAGQAWITPSGYQRERRGARDTAVRDFHFGRSALLQARQRLLDIGEKQRANRQALIEVTDPLVAVQSLLAGVDAARELAAREPEFELARQQVDELRGELQAIEQRRETAAQDYDAMIERTKSLASALATAAQKQKAAHDRHRSVEHEYLTAKRAQIDHILAWRSLRANKPPAWRSPAALAEARFRYASSAGVEHEIRRLEELRKINTYVTDEHCEPRRDKLKADHAAMEGRIGAQHANLDRARGSTERARGAYVNKLKATLRQYARNLQQLGALAGIAVEVEHPQISNDDLSLAQASLGVQFNFDQKGLIGLNDGEASGGQQVMKSMILLIGLMMEDDGGGFVFIDEPFAHLDIFNIDKVGAFLQATKAQYIVTTPNTHNVNVFKPSDLTLVTQKRRPGGGWAPPVAFLRRDRGAAR